MLTAAKIVIILYFLSINSNVYVYILELVAKQNKQFDKLTAK